MKNNELTEVKAATPSLEGLPQEVIEYVHGLVAENAGMASQLRECRQALDALITNKPTLAGLLCGSTTLGNLKASLYQFRKESTNLDRSHTEAYICGLQAQGIDKWIESRDGRWNGTTKEAEEFAVNLRAGRKG